MTASEDWVSAVEGSVPVQPSDQRFEELVRSIDSIVWEADAGTFRFTYVSPQAQRLLGYPVEQWLSEPAFWASHIHPDDRERVVAYCVESAAALRDHAFEYRMVAADGREVWLRNLVTVVANGDRPTLLRGVMFDVTEQKRTATTLQESEERLRAFAESATAALWAYTAERWVFCNDTMCELTGYSREELMRPGFYLDHVIHPGFRAIADERSWKRLRGEPVSPWLEYKIVTSSGDERWLRATGGTFTANGQPATVATAFDITERKRAEEVLRESEERLDLAIQGADLAIWDYDCQSATTVHDERFARMLGRPLSGAIADAVWKELVHPDDGADLWRQWTAHVRGSAPSYEVEVRMLAGDGTWKWLRSRGRVMARDEQGKALRVAGTYLDITDQKRAEQAQEESEADMRAIFESSGDGIILMAPDFQILRANRQARDAVRALFGRELDTSASILEQVPGEARDFLRATVLGVAAGGDLVNVEGDLPGPDGPVPHEFDFAPIHLDDGTLRGVGMAVRNIAKRKQDEATLRQAQRMESLGQLVGGIAHDFNNLLAAILGYAELAASAVPPGSTAGQDIEEVIGAAKSAADLTRQLLTFARRQHVEQRDVDLTEVLPKIERLLARLIGDDIVVNLSLDPQPLVVRIDPGQFEQVIVNLAINARDAMASGGRLTIESCRVELEESTGTGGWARVSVTDTGCGMTAETAERMFEPFFTTKEPGKGTGLGMATVHGIVAEAAGEIDVQSTPGRGTTVSILLPLSATTSLPASGSSTVAASSEAPGGRGRVLVIEDQDRVRRLAEQTLVRRGYEVLLASNPVQAIELAAAHADIDLIVSDLVMPFMDGLALTDLLKGILGDKPVIFMSGYADRTLLSGARERPGARFLAKPFSPEALLSLVRESLSNWRASR
jgi:two-component system, cell cycle sensor histidine kinase and response regulator CckA